MDFFKLYFVLLVKSHIKSYPCPHQILIQHIIKFSFLLEKSIMDGVYVIFILVEHHFFFYFFILEEVWLMVWQFIIQMFGFQEFFFSSSILIRRYLWRILCSQSIHEEVLQFSFSTPIS